VVNLLMTVVANRIMHVRIVTSSNVGATFSDFGSLQIIDSWFVETVSFSHVLPPSLDGLEFSCSIYVNK